jgi:iron complex outermembrane receptor protein
MAVSMAGFATQVHAAEADDPAVIRVTGHPDPEGLLPDQTAPKAISAISSDFIIKQAPTLNAFQLVSLLPGANVSSTDPYGLSATSSLTLRGMGQDQIGVLMEGAPQNDIGYYYAYPSQFADAENIRQVALTQGAVDMDSPTLGATGGLLSLTLDDPAKKRGLWSISRWVRIMNGAALSASTPARSATAACAPLCPIRTIAPTIGAGRAMICATILTANC